MDVDARGGWPRTKVASTSIANDTGRNFMRCWRVLSGALWYPTAVVTINNAKKAPIGGYRGVSQDRQT